MITVDLQVWERFQNLYPKQASAYCNEQLRLRVAFASGNVSGVDIELLKIKEREAMAVHDEAVWKLSEIQDQLKIVEKKNQEIEIKHLEAEKVKIDAMSQCDGCSAPMQKPRLKIGNQKFCTQCWNNQHPKMLEAFKNQKK